MIEPGRRVSPVTGLLAEDSDQVDPEPILIDAGLASIIALLNHHGARTRYCCSGLPEDHDELCDFYIVFDEICPGWAIDLFTSRGFEEDSPESRSYALNPARRIVRFIPWVPGRHWTCENPGPLRLLLRDIEQILLDKTPAAHQAVTP